MSWRSRSYDELPALAVRGPELRSSLRVVTVAWMYGVVWMACISSSHVPVFSKLVGFNNFHFGLMAAIPFLATFSQLFASLLIERTGLRKYQFMHCATIHRLLWIPIALVPLFLPVPSHTAVTLVLVLLAVSWFIESLARPAWLTWMGDLIPPRIRGRYFARRGRRSQAVMICVVILLGLLMDHNWDIWQSINRHVPLPFMQDAGQLAQGAGGNSARRQFEDITTPQDRAKGTATYRHTADGWLVTTKTANGKAPASPAAMPSDATLLGEMQKGRLLLWTMCGVFFVAALFGAKDILLFRSIREVLPPIHATTPPKPTLSLRRELVSMFAGPLRDRVFRHYVAYSFAVTFSICVSSVYFWLHAMEDLGFGQLATNLLFLAIGPLADMVAAPIWGKLMDRWGRKPVLILATVGTMFSLAPWFFATRSTPAPAWLGAGLNWLSMGIGSLFGEGDYHIVTADTPLGAYLLAMLGCIIGGTSWSGVNLAQLGVMLNFSDGSGRSKSVAVSGVMISMGGFIGGYAGGWLTYHLQDMVAIGPFLWSNMHVVFFAAMAIRAASLGFLVGMPDPGAKPVRAMLAHVRVNVYNAVQSRVFYPLRIFGWGRETIKSETTRKD